MKTDTKFFNFIRKSFLIIAIACLFIVPVVIVFTLFCMASDTINEKTDYRIDEFKENFSSELIDHITEEQKRSLDKGINDKVLSIDYESDQQKDEVYYDGDNYSIYIANNEYNGTTTLNLSSDAHTLITLKELDVEPFTLITNSSFPLAMYQNTIIFSIDPQDSWCEGEYGECTEYTQKIKTAGEKYAGVWTYNFETEELKKVFDLSDDGIPNYNRYFSTIQDSPLVVIRNTATINGYEVSYKVRTLDVVTGEIKILYENTTLR